MDMLRQHGITHVLNCASEAETGTGAASYPTDIGQWDGRVPPDLAARALTQDTLPCPFDVEYLELGSSEGDGTPLLPQVSTARLLCPW
jgi:hypothetical protein